MTAAEFQRLLSLGGEAHGLEFKPAGPRTDKWLFSKVARAMIGMANRRDGGTIVIGVEERQKNFVRTGVTKPDRETWNHDHLSDAISSYVVPNIRFEVSTQTAGRKSYVVIHVAEFDDYPVICQKESRVSEHKSDASKLILRKGALYVRTRSGNATTEVSTEADMRDLIDLAVEKGLERFVRQAVKAGLLISTPASSAEKYEQERKDLP